MLQFCRHGVGMPMASDGSCNGRPLISSDTNGNRDLGLTASIPVQPRMLIV